MRKTAAAFLLLVLTASLSGLYAQVSSLEAFVPPENDNPGIVTVRFLIPPEYYQSPDPDFFGISINEDSPYVLGPTVYSDADEDGKYRGEVTVSANLLPGGKEGGPSKISAFYQLCRDDGVCLMPETEELLPDGETAALESLKRSPGAGSLTFYLLLALLGGLLLNVMPCVLPVLSIKALNLVKQSRDDGNSIRRHALVFGAGVAGSLLALGTAVVILKNAGEAVGWGFQFQNPYYLFSLILVLIVFALSLFDMWTLNVTAGSRVTGLVSRKGYLGSLAGGIFTVLLATPCTAPFLGTALGFAFSQSSLIILLIFLFIGIGLALPFTLLGFIPALIRRLPKPGPWMNTFKEAMGLLLIATAAWLTSVLITQLGPSKTLTLLLSLTATVALIWIWGRFGQKAKTRIVRRTTALTVAGLLILLAVTVPAGWKETESGESAVVKEGWVTFSPEAVEAARSEGRPVFIQFTADWCLTCKTNEATVFSRAYIDELFEQFDVARFYGDYTKGDKIIHQWIENFGKAGVPVYALYPPGKPTPVLLPELLTPAILENTLINQLSW